MTDERLALIRTLKEKLEEGYRRAERTRAFARLGYDNELFLNEISIDELDEYDFIVDQEQTRLAQMGE
tara:strand:+ start:478 stop:681 length:204 start_codon:yes stop_codon:yes gene_type:complete